MYKQDLALNNLQGLICHKYQPTNQHTQKLSNMKVIVIPIVIGTLGTIPKGLVKRLDEDEPRPSKLQHC